MSVPRRWVIVSLIAGAPVVVYLVTGPHWDHSRQAQYWATLRSDLANLASAQTFYYAAHRRFSTEFDSLQYVHNYLVRIEITRADAHGWEAIATHDSVARQCTYSDTVPPRPAPSITELGRYCVGPEDFGK